MSQLKMPEDELKKEICKFLNMRKELVLCTCSNNIPRATPMDFYIEGRLHIECLPFLFHELLCEFPIDQLTYYLI